MAQSRFGVLFPSGAHRGTDWMTTRKGAGTGGCRGCLASQTVSLGRRACFASRLTPLVPSSPSSSKIIHPNNPDQRRASWGIQPVVYILHGWEDFRLFRSFYLHVLLRCRPFFPACPWHRSPWLQTRGCPQMISKEEALAREKDGSLPGNVIHLLEEGKGEMQLFGLLTRARVSLQTWEEKLRNSHPEERRPPPVLLMKPIDQWRE